jgi:hypothetical protein
MTSDYADFPLGLCQFCFLDQSLWGLLNLELNLNHRYNIYEAHTSQGFEVTNESFWAGIVAMTSTVRVVGGGLVSISFSPSNHFGDN